MRQSVDVLKRKLDKHIVTLSIALASTCNLKWKRGRVLLIKVLSFSLEYLVRCTLTSNNFNNLTKVKSDNVEDILYRFNNFNPFNLH